MDRIGQTDLLQSISHLGSLSVGKMQSMRECVKVITTANFGGIFVMNEGQALISMMVLLIVWTLILNFILRGVIFV
tara:strand:- start:153 stop:380 length:228 start_codon:yes stop_codon:yes gene_type:complete